MPNNYIQISVSGSSSLGPQLMGAVNGFARDLGTLQQLKADMDNMTDGTIFTTLEAAFGIPTNKGQSVYNLVAGAVSELAADPNFQNLINWLAATR